MCVDVQTGIVLSVLCVILWILCWHHGVIDDRLKKARMRLSQLGKLTRAQWLVVREADPVTLEKAINVVKVWERVGITQRRV